jgi:hypothetical protein
MESSVTIPSEQIVFTDFDGNEGLLVDLNTKKYYQLNETAMLIWKALEKKRSLEEIVCEVTTVYDVSEAQAKASVQRLMDNMRLYKLVS